MRRVLVIVVLLGIMWSVRSLSVPGASFVVDPLTLAAIGFVVLVSYIVGEICASFKLPRVTGYIVSGVLLGPQFSNVLSDRVVEEMQVFNTLALGLIATSAGLELHLGAVRRVWRTIAVTIAVKIPLLVLTVGGAFWLVQTNVPLLRVEGMNGVLALALIVAVLGIGTSPAITLAVIKESRASGRLSDMTLTIAVVKDLVVVVCLAAAIAIARSLIVPEQTFDAHALVELGRELGLSLAVGFGIGLAVILYLRLVNREMLLFVAVTVLLTSELTRWLHLELLLALIAAGFVVRNLSKREHDLHVPLQRVALPVFVVFFTTAGAAVDLRATLAVLPLALVLSVARAASFAVAGVVGGRAGGESASVRRNAWMAYIPQAGVTLGLLLVAAEALPQIAEPLQQISMALVAMHLIIGPVLLDVALRRTGEAGSLDVASAPAAAPRVEATIEEAPRIEATTEEAPRDRETASEEIEVEVAVDPVSPVTEAADGTIDDATARLGDETLRGIVTSIRATIQQRIEEFIADEAAELETFGLRTSRALLAGAESASDVAGVVATVLEMAPPETPERWESGLLGLQRDVAALCQALPEVTSASMRADQLARHEGDTAGVAARKLAARAFGGLRRSRRVPVRMIARTALEARFADAVVIAAASWYRTYGEVLHSVASTVRGEIVVDECRHSVGKALAAWRIEVRGDLVSALRRGIDALAAGLDAHGVPSSRSGSHRYSTVEPQIRKALETVDADRAPWRARIAAAFDTLRGVSAVVKCVERLDGMLDDYAWRPLEEVHEQLLPVTVATSARLEAARREVAARREIDEGALEGFLAIARDAFPEAHRERARRARIRFRRTTRKSHFVAAVAAITQSAPGRLTVLPTGVSLAATRRPGDVAVETLNFADEIGRTFEELILPDVSGALSEALTLVSVAEAQLREIVHIATYGLEVALRRNIGDPEAQRELALAALDRAVARARELVAELEASLSGAITSVEAAQEAATKRLQNLLDETPASARIASTVKSRARASVVAAMQRLQGVSSSLLGFSRRASRRLARQRRVQDWLISAGRQQLDAAAMARYVRERLPSPDTLEVPRLVVQAFSSVPVDDRRLLAAYRSQADEAARAVTAERGMNVVILSAPGTGSTSLLNELEYKLSDRPILRIDGELHSRVEGLVGALAAELTCEHVDEAVVNALRVKPRVVLVDDLEHLVSPTPAGIEDLLRFIRIVVDTEGAARWIVATSRDAIHALGDISLPLLEVFGCHIELEPLTWRDLKTVVGARHRLVGMVVRHATRFAAAMRLLRWKTSLEEELYYRALARVSGGALRAALLGHVRALKPDAARDTYKLEVPDRAALPFLGQLASPALAILALLVRFGPLKEAELGTALACDAVVLLGHTRLLESAHIVERRLWADGEALAIPSHIEDVVARELRELRVLGEAS